MSPPGVPGWAIGIAAFVVLNVVVGVAYIAVGKAEQRMEPVAAVGAASAPVAPTSVPEPAPASNNSSGIAIAERVAGLKALEVNDFAAAAASFQRAIVVGGGPSDLPELLRIATELRGKDADKAPTKVVEEDTKKSSNSNRSRSKPRAPEAPRPAFVVVTSTPSSMAVYVDGKNRDVTPARIEVSPGSHTIALRQGDRMLWEGSIEAKAGGVATVERDFSAELAPKSEPRVAERPPPAPSPPPVAPKETVPAVAAVAAVAADGFGEILVESPFVLGEVWVNGSKVGYPPIIARQIRSGNATVEVRVKGVVKKSKTVAVVKGERVKAVMK